MSQATKTEVDCSFYKEIVTGGFATNVVLEGTNSSDLNNAAGSESSKGNRGYEDEIFYIHLYAEYLCSRTVFCT